MSALEGIGLIFLLFLAAAAWNTKLLLTILSKSKRTAIMSESAKYGAPMDDRRKEVFFHAVYSRKGRVRGIALLADKRVKLLTGVLLKDGVLIEPNEKLSSSDYALISSIPVGDDDVIGKVISDDAFLEYTKMLDLKLKEASQTLRINVEKQNSKETLQD